TSFSEAAFGNAFLGLSSDTAITSVAISFRPTTDLDWTPFVNNIAFGPAVSAVPEPATAWTLAFVALLSGVGGWISKKIDRFKVY
ncbi:MAG TPA: hypothetical protein VG168_14635, partial [Bryobacteraceae bacterium]|nr:hypothetical protein [Bryobacteraceae bacterium]